MAPVQYRGAFSNGFQFSLCLGSLAATLVNYGSQKITGGWGWRLSLALAGVPAGRLARRRCLPETPLLLPETKALLQKMRGVDAVDDELDDIVAAAESSMGADNGLRLILTQRRYRPQLVMAILIPAFTQLTGINAAGFYAPELLRTIGMGESASLLCTVATVVVFTASTIVFMFFIDRFGRRALLLAGGIQMLVSEALIGAFMATKLGDEGGLSRSYALALFVLIGVYVAGYSWSWGPMSWLVPSEIFPLEVRSAGQSITVASGFVFTIFIAQCFLAMLCRMKAGLFFFFAGWIMVMTAFACLLLPETKGMPIEQIGKVWGEHWFWKRVVGVEGVQDGGDKL